MVISDFAIKRPMITVVTMVALVVFGLFALWRLQTDEFPDIQQPVVLTLIPVSYTHLTLPTNREV